MIRDERCSHNIVKNKKECTTTGVFYLQLSAEPSHLHVKIFKRYLPSHGMFTTPVYPNAIVRALVAVQSTLLEKRAIILGEERINPDPQQGENGGKQNGPDNDNRGCSVLPTNKTFQEWIEMDDHPE